MIDILRHVFAYGIKSNDAVARITLYIFFTSLIMRHGGVSLFESLNDFIDSVFFIFGISFIDIGQVGKKLCFAKENPDSVLAPDSMRFLAAIWKTHVFFPSLYVCRWIDTQWQVWCVHTLAMNKTREQLDDILMRKCGSIIHPGPAVSEDLVLFFSLFSQHCSALYITIYME